MPITLKQGMMAYKGGDGEYHGINVVGETTTAEQVAAVQSAGTSAVASVQAAGQAARESIPSDYTTLTEEVSDLKSAIGIAISEESQSFTLNDRYWISIANKNVAYASGAAYDATRVGIPVTEGEMYKISASTYGTDYALYALGDENGITDTYPASAFEAGGLHTIENLVITIPAGITRLFLSRYSTNVCSCAKMQNSESARVDTIEKSLGYEVIDIDAYTEVIAVINSNNVAQVDGTKNVSRQYDIANAKEIIIRANNSRPTVCSILSASAVGIANGAAPAFATGETRHEISAGTEEKFVVPSDAAYLLISQKISNVSGYLPESISVVYGGLGEKVYGIVIDDTLSNPGECADAKATGDELTYLKTDFYHNVGGNNYEWVQGGYNATNGNAAASDTLIRCPAVLNNDIRFVSCADGYVVRAYGFSGNTYLGMWKNGAEFSTNVSSGTFDYDTLDLRVLMATATKINIAAKKVNGDDITPSDASNITFGIIGTLETNPCEYDWKDEACTFDKILCIGDSLIEGGANNPNITPDPANAKRTVTRGMYSVPRFLEKMFGITTSNWGVSGATSRSWYNAKSVSEPDWGGYDGALIYIGSNDYNYATSEGMTIEQATATSRTYIGNIISKLKTDNPGIRIFLCTLLPNTTTGTMAQYRVPLMEAIRDIAANDSSVFLIDLNIYSSFKSGSAYSNGHPTAIGYQWMAREIGACMCWWIANSPNDFKWIRQIGTQYAVVDGTAPDQDDDGSYDGDVD